MSEYLFNNVLYSSLILKLYTFYLFTAYFARYKFIICKIIAICRVVFQLVVDWMIALLILTLLIFVLSDTRIYLISVFFLFGLTKWRIKIHISLLLAYPFVHLPLLIFSLVRSSDILIISACGVWQCLDYFLTIIIVGESGAE